MTISLAARVLCVCRIVSGILNIQLTRILFTFFNLWCRTFVCVLCNVMFNRCRVEIKKLLMYSKQKTLLPSPVLIIDYLCPTPIVNINSGLTRVQVYNAREAQVKKDPHFNHHRKCRRFLFCEQTSLVVRPCALLSSNSKVPRLDWSVHSQVLITQSSQVSISLDGLTSFGLLRL